MKNKETTRLTVEIPVKSHTKLKLMATLEHKSMKTMICRAIEEFINRDYECKMDHTPNEETKRALDNVLEGKNLHKVDSSELF